MPKYLAIMFDGNNANIASGNFKNQQEAWGELEDQSSTGFILTPAKARRLIKLIEKCIS